MKTDAAKPPLFNDPALIERLHELRKTDNTRNWYYLIRAWVYLVLVLGGAVWFFVSRADWGLSWWWNVPVALVAGILVGAGQHQLAGLMHEGSHHMLFRHKPLNEIISNIFCAFPLISMTYLYRVQHHAHHQFVNDDERDPDLWQQKRTGHWLEGPKEKRELLKTFLKWLWPVKLIVYSASRARSAAGGGGANPYRNKDRKYSKVPKHTFLGSALIQMGLMTVLVLVGDPWLLAAGGAALWIGTLVRLAMLSEDEFVSSRVRTALPHKPMWLLRATHLHAIIFGLALTTLLTGRWAGVYALVLWALPLSTSFSLFMMLRQVVQHANNDRGRITNTHTFLVNPFVRWAIFPIGQDYHLPHHLFASVPHYRLKALHKTLMQYPEYGAPEVEVEVEGYFSPRRPPPRPPTVIEALGPGHTRNAEEIYIDDACVEADL